MLWAYRTTPRCSTRETPFSMTYGAETVIPVEIGLLASRFEVFQVKMNDQLLCKHLDLIEENCDNTSVPLANYQQKHSRGYNKGVKSREFILGDLVLRKVVGNTRDPAMGKLGLTQEGPYRVTSIAGIGAYQLEDLDKKPVARPWNVFNLEKYCFRQLYNRYLLYFFFCVLFL